jgi:hypothetical protein
MKPKRAFFIFPPSFFFSFYFVRIIIT